MRKILFCVFCVIAAPAFAQTQSIVVPACAPTYMPIAQPGQPYPSVTGPNGNQCVVVAGAPAPPAVFNMPGPPVLNRWRQSCQCFVSPP
jgi:hypothetical protein